MSTIQAALEVLEATQTQIWRERFPEFILESCFREVLMEVPLRNMDESLGCKVELNRDVTV